MEKFSGLITKRIKINWYTKKRREKGKKIWLAIAVCLVNISRTNEKMINDKSPVELIRYDEWLEGIWASIRFEWFQYIKYREKNEKKMKWWRTNVLDFHLLKSEGIFDITCIHCGVG